MNEESLRLGLDLLSLTSFRVTVKFTSLLIILLFPGLNKKSFLASGDWVKNDRKVPLERVGARDEKVDEAIRGRFILPAHLTGLLLHMREIWFKQPLHFYHFFFGRAVLPPPSSV